MSKPLAIVIEDDPQLATIYRISLQTDYAVEVLMDGSAGLARLEQVVPTLVVLDLHMPGAKGTKVLSHIRADARLSATRIFLTTADDRQADLLRDQVDLVLLKPVSPLQLRQLASRFIPRD